MKKWNNIILDFCWNQVVYRFLDYSEFNMECFLAHSQLKMVYSKLFTHI